MRLHKPISRLANRGSEMLEFLWSGWAGFAALCLFAAAWQAGHEAYGPFILSSPLETLRAIIVLGHDPDAWRVALVTFQRACTGFLLVIFTGGALGIVAGYFPATMRITSPLVTVLLGVPPIAWIVLTMIWFGGSDATVRTVILVACFPVVFLGAARGISTRDLRLDRMAEAFGAGPVKRFFTIGLRQTTTTLFPALSQALGGSFKVAVMAELLSNAGGIGSALADARSNLDIANVLAWIVIVTGLLMMVEYILIQPVKNKLDRWRRAARQSAVKR